MPAVHANTTISIHQVNGIEASANAYSLALQTGQDKMVNIEQGSTAIPTTGNRVDATISRGELSVHQLTDGNQALVNIQGGGSISITQGNNDHALAGGAGFRATALQTGSGHLQLEQGHAIGDTSTGGEVTAVQGNGNVTITQSNTTAASVIHTNTSSTGAGKSQGGSLTVAQNSANGAIYINRHGDAGNAEPIAIADGHTLSVSQTGSGGVLSVAGQQINGDVSIATAFDTSKQTINLTETSVSNATLEVHGNSGTVIINF